MTVARRNAIFVSEAGGAFVETGIFSDQKVFDSVAVAPSDPDRISAFLNIRVADIQAVYEGWSSRGAEFLAPPEKRKSEYRCYMRDPDGHLIEVGQSF